MPVKYKLPGLPPSPPGYILFTAPAYVTLTQEESQTLCAFVTGTLHFAKRLQGSSTRWQVPGPHVPFLRLNNIPRYGSIHSLTTGLLPPSSCHESCCCEHGQVCRYRFQVPAFISCGSLPMCGLAGSHGNSVCNSQSLGILTNHW